MTDPKYPGKEEAKAATPLDLTKLLSTGVIAASAILVLSIPAAIIIPRPTSDEEKAASLNTARAEVAGQIQELQAQITEQKQQLEEKDRLLAANDEQIKNLQTDVGRAQASRAQMPQGIPITTSSEAASAPQSHLDQTSTPSQPVPIDPDPIKSIPLPERQSGVATLRNVSERDFLLGVVVNGQESRKFRVNVNRQVQFPVCQADYCVRFYELTGAYAHRDYKFKQGAAQSNPTLTLRDGETGLTRD